MTYDPALIVAANLLESLTTPDKEDWTIIPKVDEVYVNAFREFGESEERHCHARYYVVPLAEFKSGVCRLTPDHNLGHVQLFMLADYESMGGLELYDFLSKQAREKNFSFTTMHGPAKTEQALNSLQAMYDKGKAS